MTAPSFKDVSVARKALQDLDQVTAILVDDTAKQLEEALRDLYEASRQQAYATPSTKSIFKGACDRAWKRAMEAREQLASFVSLN